MATTRDELQANPDQSPAEPRHRWSEPVRSPVELVRDAAKDLEPHDEGNGTLMVAASSGLVLVGWIVGPLLGVLGSWTLGGLVCFFAAFFAVAIALSAPGFVMVEVLFGKLSWREGLLGAVLVAWSVLGGTALGLFGLGAMIFATVGA